MDTFWWFVIQINRANEWKKKSVHFGAVLGYTFCQYIGVIAVLAVFTFCICINWVQWALKMICFRTIHYMQEIQNWKWYAIEIFHSNADKTTDVYNLISEFSWFIFHQNLPVDFSIELRKLKQSSMRTAVQNLIQFSVFYLLKRN